MNLKSFVYNHTGENLLWSEGSIIKLAHDLSYATMNDVDMAIFFKNLLIRSFRYRESSPSPEIWDESINRQSAKYAYYLNKLENV